MTRLFACVVAPMLLVGCAHADGPAPSEQKPVVRQPPAEARPLSPADSAALADFKSRVDNYVKVHQALEDRLPPMPKETTPEVVVQHERALEKLLRTELRSARQGDLLTPPIRRMFREVLARVFSGPDGRDLKATIQDENPGPIRLTINGRYPDQVPFSTVPPQVLAALPKLPSELEYRFVGERLVLLDIHSSTIADYMENAFPR